MNPAIILEKLVIHGCKDQADIAERVVHGVLNPGTEGAQPTCNYSGLIATRHSSSIDQK
ncbi:hypothetical protein ACX12L_16650 [Alicycliphilus sp. T452]|jgi:hypothetical protein